jgi:cytoskeleton protein RodZ
MVEEQSGQSAAAGSPMLSVGALLAEARSGKGRELSDIARETRVPLRHLMAIEADDHDSLPALPYALGFVKAFARSVGLDAEAIGARFRAETRMTPHVPTTTSLEPLDEARLPSRGLAYGALAGLVIVLAGLGLYGAGVFDKMAIAPASVSEPVVGGAEVAAAGDRPVAGGAEPAAVGARPLVLPPVPASIPAIGAVVLTAKQDVWLRIQDPATRRRAFMGVLSAGQSWQVPDGAALVMRTGRAGVIELRVAGVLLPALGQINQTLDGVVLTAPALAERFAGQPLPPQTPPAAVPPVQQAASPAAAQGAMPAGPAGARPGA